MGVGGGRLAVAIHDVELAMIAPRIGGDEGPHRGGGGMPCAQQLETVHAEKRIDQRLGRDRTGARSDVGNERADGKELRCNRNAEFPALALARDDGPGHVCPTKVARTRCAPLALAC